jgi:hypothetical protein
LSIADAHSESNPNAYWALPKPTWDAWNRKSKCLLWEAVTLACDVDPGLYLPHGLSAESGVDSVLQRVPGNVLNLLGLAKIAVASEKLKTTQFRSDDLMRSEVDLSEFTAWLNKLGHTPPVEYHWTARELATGQFQWPWGSYQTKGLQVLALATDRFWKNYDPSDSSTAPKSEDVIAWLEVNGIARRKAEIMASLLRADDLAPGPR